MISFRKMHGLGNDFVILDQRGPALPALSSRHIQLIADRRLGVGCDQMIVLEPSARADVFMRIYNPDGSEAGACGNATRCVAHIIDRDACVIETVSGLLPCRRTGGMTYEVDMGEPSAIGVTTVDKYDAVTVDMGNPHCIIFVDNVDDIPLAETGPRIEEDPQFSNRTNVEFATCLSPDKIRMRVWERGAGITLACGSGACATLVAAARRGLTGRKAEIVMDGGSLSIEWRETDNHVLMTGPVSYVFDGVLKAL